MRPAIDDPTVRPASFKLGTFSIDTGEPFPGLVLEPGGVEAGIPSDEARAARIAPLPRLLPLLREIGASLSGTGSLLSLLEHWPENLQALVRLCADAYPEVLRLSLPEARARIHAPIPAPRQIFCTVANYRNQVTEAVVDAGVPPHTDGMSAEQRRQYAARVIEARLESQPYVCCKLPTTVIGPVDSLALPTRSKRVDWEVELAAVLGHACRRVTREQAMSRIAGYMLVNDITARDLVRRADLPNLGTDWLQSKNAPGFLPTGPYLVPACFIPDPYAVRLSLRLNGKTMQDDLVADMMFDIATQIEYISEHVQLLPGDIVCTGTPGGCGTHYGRFLQPGDVLEAFAAELGAQRVQCV
ncbi:MAG TPA: fumarylacetoacetate hydrolase family protein [Steroidobacteraceae bacterium]|nr:fumarylacetoacetate hydrolase family protein [Steroidobacteraceae bacterium]